MNDKICYARSVILVSGSTGFDWFEARLFRLEIRHVYVA